MPTDDKFEKIREPRLDEKFKRLDEQYEQEENQSQIIKPQTPAAVNVPMPDATMTAGITANVSPMTGLTGTEDALLSDPLERAIAKNRRSGIGSLI